MVSQLLQVVHTFAELALGMRIGTLLGIMSNLVKFSDFSSTTFTDYLHVITVIKLMCTQDEFIICQLVLASLIVALESDLIQVLNFEFIKEFQSLECIISITLAWSVEEFG